MIEQELRNKFTELTAGRSLRGFWHSSAGKFLRKEIEKTPFENFERLQEKIWSLSNNLNSKPKCKICGNPAAFYQYAYLDTCSTGCGAKLGSQSEKSKLNVKSMMLAATSDLARAKRKNTLKNTWAYNKEDILKRTQETNLNKYGYKWGGQSEVSKTKRAATNIEKYGVASVFATKEIRAKAAATSIAKYNETTLPDRLSHILENQNIIPLFEKWIGCDAPYQWKHISCGYEFTHYLSGGIVPTCPHCRPKSLPQFKIQQFLLDQAI